MKSLLRTIALTFIAFCQCTCSPPLLAATPTTGQFLFQRKPASGAFEQFGVTPITNQVFGWDGTNVVMLGMGGGIAWGDITGTLSAQTDLQSALNLKLSLAGVLPLAGFSSITGTLPDANLSANVQLKNGTLALGNFGSITGTLADGRLSANVQLKNGTLALDNFGSVTGTLAAARIADLSGTYLTVSAAASGYQPLDADLTAIAALTGTNNLYYRSAANTWTSVTMGTGLSFSGGTLAATTAGTVSSVALTAPAVFSIAGSPITTSGTLALSLATQTANRIWAGPTTGSAATPTFRALVSADVPDLSSTYLTVAAAASGYQPLDADLTALAALTGTNNLYYRSAANTWTGVAFGSGLSFSGGTLSTSLTGTVTSVALTAPSFLSVSGSPVTTSGTLALSLANQTANTILAGPTSGSATTPAFRALVAADIPSLSATYLTPAAAAAAYQPLDADLTAIAALSGTNNIYYRSAANTWTGVTMGSGLSFSGGTLTATSSTLTPTTFANGAARAAATPTALFQLGVQRDSRQLYYGNTLTAGDWNSDWVVQSIEGAQASFDSVNAATALEAPFLSLQGATSGGIQLQSTATAGNGTITIDAGTNTFSLTNGTAGVVVPAGVSGTLGTSAFVTLGSNVGTFLATPSGANLASALTTAIPASKGGTGLTALGTGVATALGINTGTSGSFIVSSGAGTISGSIVTGGTFGAVNGSALTTINGSSISSGTVADTRLSANVQLKNGTLALSGFASITGTLPAARVGDLSATYLTVAAALAGYQPLDADLTAISALAGTNNIYYRSAANTWTSVTVGSGLSFSGGTLTATGGSALTPTTFASDAARDSAVASAVGQLGQMADPGVVGSPQATFYANSTTAGDWFPVQHYYDATHALSNLGGSLLNALGTVIYEPGAGGTFYSRNLNLVGGTSGSITLAAPATVGGDYVITITGSGTGALNIGAGGTLGALAFVTPGTGVATALAVNTGTSGSFIVSSGAGTISGGAVTGGTFGAVNGSALTALNASSLASGTAAVTIGGTGRLTGTTAYSLVATGTTATGAQQTLANGATTEILVGGGAAALPAWTTATGTGAPVRAGSPTFTGTASFASIAATDVTVSSAFFGPAFYSSTGHSRVDMGGAGTTMYLIAGDTIIATLTSGGSAITGALSVSGAVMQTAKTTTYNNIATAGNGLVAIVKATRVTAQSAANASIATYTAPASDGSYEVSMNLNATAVTVMSASLNCDYTDESNTARTMILPVQSLAGNFVSGGLVTATGPYETPVMHIRVKASTAITLYTSTGTYTGVTYTAEGIIKQTQ